MASGYNAMVKRKMGVSVTNISDCGLQCIYQGGKRNVKASNFESPV